MSTPVPQPRAYENPADRPEPMPAQPAGAPIGRRDSLMNELRPRLAEWVKMWHAAMPGFQVDSLWSGGRRPWKTAWQDLPPPRENAPRMPWEDLITGEVFSVRSPDSSCDLDIDTYQAIVEDENGFSVGGEPDSRSVLYDRARNREAVLFFSGTPAGAHWGRWFDPRRFALAGWSDASDSGHWKQGWISVYSGADSSVTDYVTRIVPDTTFERYRAAWEHWVEARYRALKPQPRL
jgi:hypothetical protein